MRNTATTAKPARRLTAVLFVDIVDATPLALSLGDRPWAELLERYHELVRAALDRHRGWLMDTAGDGLFAIFDETADAVFCALEIRLAAGEFGLELRSGVHLGHCWTADEKCAGADVHVGARLASVADPGEILVSEEAAERAHQGGIAVADRGLRSLKGLPGTRRVFAVSDERTAHVKGREAGKRARLIPPPIVGEGNRYLQAFPEARFRTRTGDPSLPSSDEAGSAGEAGKPRARKPRKREESSENE